MKSRKIIFLVLFELISVSGKAADWVDSTLFSPKVFIENKGQFEGNVQYGLETDGTEIYFSAEGLTYTYVEVQKEEGRDAEGRRKMLTRIPHSFQMSWEGASPEAKIIAEAPVSFYFTYGDLRDRSGKSSIKASAFKKITYKNIYPSIDIEYIFPENKPGIKYNIILHPGADASVIKMKYSGAKNVRIDGSGNVQITTPFGNIVDHAPQTFYKGGENIHSAFSLSGNVVSFQLKTSNLKPET